MFHLKNKKKKINFENLKNSQENNEIKRLLLTGTYLKPFDQSNQHSTVVSEEPITAYKT